MDAVEYLRDLPDDAGQALIKIDERFRASLRQATESTYGPLRKLQLILCLEWAKQHNLDLPTKEMTAGARQGQRQPPPHAGG